jgi:hypothetical protein
MVWVAEIRGAFCQADHLRFLARFDKLKLLLLCSNLGLGCVSCELQFLRDLQSPFRLLGMPPAVISALLICCGFDAIVTW